MSLPFAVVAVLLLAPAVVVSASKSFVEITTPTSSEKFTSYPFSYTVAQRISLTNEIVIVGNFSNDCNLTSHERSRAKGKVVFVEPTRFCWGEHLTVAYRYLAGARGIIIYVWTELPGAAVLRPTPVQYYTGNSELSVFPVAEISRAGAQTLERLLAAGENVTVSASLDAEENPYVAMCKPFGVGTVLMRGVLPLLNGAVMATALYRWSRFVRANGCSLMLAQAVYAVTVPMCLFNLLHLVPDGLLCRRSAYPAGILDNLFITLQLPFMLATTLTISFYFRGVVTAKKGRSPLQRFRCPLAIACVFLIAMELTTAVLRAMGSSAAINLSGAVYLLVMLFLGIFFAVSSIKILIAIATGGGSSSSSGGNSGGGVGGYNADNASHVQALRMARWLLATAVCLLAAVAVAAFFALGVPYWGYADWYLGTWVSFFAARTGVMFTQMMVFKTPRSSTRVTASTTNRSITPTRRSRPRQQQQQQQ